MMFLKWPMAIQLNFPAARFAIIHLILLQSNRFCKIWIDQQNCRIRKKRTANHNYVQVQLLLFCFSKNQHTTDTQSQTQALSTQQQRIHSCTDRPTTTTTKREKCREEKNGQPTTNRNMARRMKTKHSQSMGNADDGADERNFAHFHVTMRCTIGKKEEERKKKNNNSETRIERYKSSATQPGNKNPTPAPEAQVETGQSSHCQKQSSTQSSKIVINELVLIVVVHLFGYLSKFSCVNRDDYENVKQTSQHSVVVVMDGGSCSNSCH